MIVCVAANPSVDKLFQVERVVPGGIHRPTGYVQVAGGKGLNAARAAATLGADVQAIALLAGHAGRWIAEQLERDAIHAQIVWAEGETRASLSVADRETEQLTEFYEDGIEVDDRLDRRAARFGHRQEHPDDDQDAEGNIDAERPSP